jgi:hypothetical protein
MARPLAEQLADLAQTAKRAQETVAASLREPRDNVQTRREQARAAAADAADKVSRDLRAAGDIIVQQWDAHKAKVAADLNRLKANLADQRPDRPGERADKRAARLQSEAAIAIDYARAAIEDAKLAALDAVIAKLDTGDARATAADTSEAARSQLRD